ncbi:23S rRNA (guanine(745)-N(1))-methyltransferase [Thalassomonas haliotis]|uniref:23S rRNA (Guanine(745)-N(1))-methyltransferase n=1 Tax=Thalassomonas haliotis TaxID=485448 RepID=A0ABY7VA18_9GAMM|nr:23S rRNA (guanine(745)-N(1))-methyltransferase [Thalassomonas haliotis]WDE09758.1 23S rRNA (guanine(745)-N(1))-methyltransferase [Thalassomonas haliotis]
MSSPHYLCPICRLALSSRDAGFRCNNNHHFDRAKEGYVNLLPVQHKHSKDPGDNKAMVLARRAFLEQGYYQPLIDKLTSLYQAHGDTHLPVLDAGCGEGYYTHQHKTDNNSVYGVDIAKNAVKIAAKRHKNCHFSVGTLSHLPFEDVFFGWIFSIYAPILEPEFTRVLKSGAYLLTVTPAEDHLFELKSLIYRQPQQHDTGKTPIKALTLIHEEKLNYQMDFTGPEDVINLLAMTPFAFKTSEELLEKIKAMTSFSCQADFHIRLYQKTG